jgi:phosphoribosylanthranilate isomerase
VKIKLCGVRTVADALMCAEEGADEIGVVLAAGSKRRVTTDEAKAIRTALPSRVPLVGVFRDADFKDVLNVVQWVGLQAAQLHGNWLALPGDFPFYAALQVAGPESLEPRLGAARILLDGPSAGSGKSFSWLLARKARTRYSAPIFIAGGLDANNVADAIAEARPDGVDVASGIEAPDGFKDPARVRAFVRAVRGNFK